MRHLLFDIDNTITPPRRSITEPMADVLWKVMEKYPVHLITGSDFKKVQEQLGAYILWPFYSIHTCSGNEVYVPDRLGGLKKDKVNPWQPSKKLLDELDELLDISSYPVRHGNHVELRTGSINFSICGRNANFTQRKLYNEWDKKTNERKLFVQSLTKTHPELDFIIGGEISIDITEKGKNKSQFIDWFKKEFDKDKIVFFGDKVLEGNDKPLADAIIKEQLGNTYNVKNWKNTKRMLTQLLKGSQ